MKKSRLVPPSELSAKSLRASDYVTSERSKHVGDRVKFADADSPLSIPAYRAMRGTVVGIAGPERLRVHWDCDPSPEPYFRRQETVALAEDT